MGNVQAIAANLKLPGVDLEKHKKIKDVCASTLGAFGEAYVEAFRLVLVRHVKQKMFRGESLQPKPVDVYPISSISITSFETRQSGSSPYTVFVIESSSGGKYRTVRRRYRKFDEMYRALQRSVPGVPLPPMPPKKVMGNMKHEFICARMQGLDHLLKSLAQNPSTATNVQFHAFLGLVKGPGEEINNAAFEIAYKKTMKKLKKQILPVDDQEEALSSMVTDKIMEEVLPPAHSHGHGHAVGGGIPGMNAGMMANPMALSGSMAHMAVSSDAAKKGTRKIIDTVVGKGIQLMWSSIRGSTASMQEKIMTSLAPQFEQFVQIEANVVTKLEEVFQQDLASAVLDVHPKAVRVASALEKPLFAWLDEVFTEWHSFARDVVETSVDSPEALLARAAPAVIDTAFAKSLAATGVLAEKSTFAALEEALENEIYHNLCAAAVKQQQQLRMNTFSIVQRAVFRIHSGAKESDAPTSLAVSRAYHDFCDDVRAVARHTLLSLLWPVVQGILAAKIEPKMERKLASIDALIPPPFNNVVHLGSIADDLLENVGRHVVSDCADRRLGVQVHNAALAHA